MEGTQCDASAAEKASAEPRDARPHRPFAGEKGAATRCSWTDVAAAHGQAHHDDEVARRWPMRVERWAWSVERGAMYAQRSAQQHLLHAGRVTVDQKLVHIDTRRRLTTVM